MAELRASLRARLASIIRAYHLEPLDFEWTDSPKPSFPSSKNAVELKHKHSNFFIKVEEGRNSDQEARLFITYAPNEGSLSPEIVAVKDWERYVAYFETWIKLVVSEVTADDPWSTLSESSTFKDEDTKFTQAELVNVDKAVDAAFTTLLQRAADSGQNRTLKSIQKDIKFLKDEARKQTRNKWLDLFKQVVAGMVLEWGLQAAVNADVLNTLYEAAKPILTIVG